VWSATSAVRRAGTTYDREIDAGLTRYRDERNNVATSISPPRPNVVWSVPSEGTPRHVSPRSPDTSALPPSSTRWREVPTRIPEPDSLSGCHVPCRTQQPVAPSPALIQATDPVVVGRLPSTLPRQVHRFRPQETPVRCPRGVTGTVQWHAVENCRGQTNPGTRTRGTDVVPPSHGDPTVLTHTDNTACSDHATCPDGAAALSVPDQ
jgi:hypothetical protein